VPRDGPDIRDEGLIFVDPMLTMASDRQTTIRLRNNLPLAPISTLREIGRMYPLPSASNGRFAHQFDRVKALISGIYILANPS
jgi:hypothetical protein